MKEVCTATCKHHFLDFGMGWQKAEWELKQPIKCLDNNQQDEGFLMDEFRAIVIFCSLLFSCVILHAATLKFSGEAAQTLYVCDEYAAFDCCYISPKAHCRVENDEAEVVSYNHPQLTITGRFAKRVHALTKECHDDDVPKWRYYYGHQGIDCSTEFGRGLTCDLTIDSYTVE